MRSLTSRRRGRAGRRRAAALDDSLDWQAGRTSECGAPHPPRRRALDGACIRALRADLSITEDAVLDALDLARSAWRRLLSGGSAPVLGDLVGRTAAGRVQRARRARGVTAAPSARHPPRRPIAGHAFCIAAGPSAPRRELDPLVAEHDETRVTKSGEVPVQRGPRHSGSGHEFFLRQAARFSQRGEQALTAFFDELLAAAGRAPIGTRLIDR